MTPLILLAIFILSYFIFKDTIIFTNIKQALLVLIVCFFVISIILYPKEAVDAAKAGIDTWFYIVFPALLPFFIGAELLIGLGVVKFIGVLLEPIIRPIFNVPGEGSFVIAMSVTSGYPMGVKLVSDLHNQRVFTKEEAQRLLAFSSTSGPLFMIGAVAIGMFNSIQLGIILAVSHYLGAIATGILFKFYKYKKSKYTLAQISHGYRKNAFNELKKVLQGKHAPFGFILGAAVKNSVETLLVVGGFIILFSVIIHFLTFLGFTELVFVIIESAGFEGHIHKNLIKAVVSGIFEITTGCKLLSEIYDISFFQQTLFSTMIISWSGFSIHAQASSLISKTDLSTAIYIFSKLFHSIFSGFFVFLTFFLTAKIPNSIDFPVFFTTPSYTELPSWSQKLFFSSELFVIITAFTVITAIFIHALFGLLHFKVDPQRKK